MIDVDWTYPRFRNPSGIPSGCGVRRIPLPVVSLKLSHPLITLVPPRQRSCATKILCDKMRLDPPLQDTLQIRRAGMHPSPARPHETERKLEKQRILKQNVAIIVVHTGVGIVTQQIAATKHARHHGVTIKKRCPHVPSHAFTEIESTKVVVSQSLPIPPLD